MVCLVAADLTEQKRTEEIVASERLAKLIFEQATEAFIICDIDGVIIRASEEAKRLVGEDLYFQAFDQAFPLSHIKEGDSFEIRKILAGAVLRKEEFTLRHKKGEHELLLSAGPIRSGDRIMGCVVMMIDISERKKWEKALQESEQKLRLALNAAEQGTWEWDITANKLNYSEKTKALFGLGADASMTFELFYSLLYPDDQDRIRMGFLSIMNHGGLFHEDMRVVWPDKTVHWVESSGELYLSEKDEPLRMTGVMRDITQYKEAEEALLKQKHVMDTLMEATSDYIFMLDRDKRYIYANPRALRPLGIDLAAICGKTWRELGLHPESLEPFENEIESVFATGKTIRNEMIYPSDGGYKHYEYFINPVSGPHGEIGAVAVSSRDIAQRKQAEMQLEEKTARLEEANQELEAFSYSVSHDLQGPVRAMDGFAKIIMSEYEGKMDPAFRRKFDVIRENAKLMGDLIEGLLNLSRIGRRELSLSRLNMRELFEQVWQELEIDHSGRNFEFIQDDLAPARGDHSLIRQVLYNLLSNASKFTKRRRKAVIRVGSYSEDGQMVYYVKDNGAGFDMQYYDKLFGVFQRLHGASEFQGTGIGLAIVQRIIKRHGGRLWAEGKVNKGAAFYFALPAVE